MLGRNVKITAPHSARADARKLFEALGASLATPTDAMDVFAMRDSNIGFAYVPDADALTPVQMRIAPWLEMLVDDVDAAARRLDALGLPRIDYHDKTHPYFVAPGGAVFRLAAR